MKTMHQTNPLLKAIASIFGLCGGVVSYLKIHLGFGSPEWGSYLDKTLSFFGALVIAFLSGFVGYAGGLLAKKIFKRK